MLNGVVWKLAIPRSRMKALNPTPDLILQVGCLSGQFSQLRIVLLNRLVIRLLQASRVKRADLSRNRTIRSYLVGNRRYLCADARQNSEYSAAALDKPRTRAHLSQIFAHGWGTSPAAGSLVERV